MPEFLEYRDNSAARVIMALITVVVHVVVLLTFLILYSLRRDGRNDAGGPGKCVLIAHGPVNDYCSPTSDDGCRQPISGEFRGGKLLAFFAAVGRFRLVPFGSALWDGRGANSRQL